MKNTTVVSVLSAALLSAASLSLAPAAWARDSVGTFVVTAQERAQISAGMTQDQVKQALGQPEGVMQFARGAQTSWVYSAADTLISKDPLYYVDFAPNGKVVSTQIVDPGSN